MTTSWDPKLYGQFLDLRTRPARDLLAGIPDSFQPKTVYDLGCGPGNSTILLKERWPNAKIMGIDSSPDMLKEAQNLYPAIEFTEGDIAHFSPPEKIDCLFANASLQWLDAHEALFPKLLGYINSGGAFGIQMPNNFHSPSHQVTIQILQDNPAWRSFLKNLRYGNLTEPLYKLSWYYDVLAKAGAHSLQLWETEYFQEMNNHSDIFEWVKGTGLRPVSSAMDKTNQEQFKNAYINSISQKYPLQNNGKVLLSYRRIFMVGFM